MVAIKLVLAKKDGKKVKKVGPLIDDDKDVERGKNIWIKGDKRKTSTEIKL